jgi:hypothetical protein
VTEQRWAIGRAQPDGSSASALAAVAMSALPEKVGYDSASYRVLFAQPGSLILHQFYFPAWSVLVDGMPAPTRADGSLGLLAVDVAAGEHTVAVRWGPTPAVWIGRALTLAGWAITLYLLLLAWQRQATQIAREPARTHGATFQVTIAAWLLVGVLLLIGVSGVTAQALPPAAVGADFGSVRLEAAETGPARAGSDARVRLHWSIQGPVEPLVAFVHVLDGTGAVVAQNDELLGGEYTPVERWLPGMVMAHTHTIPLPENLPLGQYGLEAGVYRPGQADAPLVAAGESEPRAAIGTLEVRP